MTGRSGKAEVPREPAARRQAGPHGRLNGEQADDVNVYAPKTFVVVVMTAPELRERYPDMPLSLQEAARVGRSPQRELEAGS